MLTPAELAAALRSSERTVARMVRDGCPSMLVGSRRRFDLEAVKRWMGERACQSAKTPMADGTPKSASLESAFTEGYRRAQLRVMPSGSKRN